MRSPRPVRRPPPLRTPAVIFSSPSKSTPRQKISPAAVANLERDLSSIMLHLATSTGADRATAKGSASAIDSRIEERWPQAQEMYRTHRLYLRQERLRREADQQLSLAASEDQRPRQQVLGGAHSVRAQYAQLAHGRGVDGGGGGGEGGGFSERRRPFREGETRQDARTRMQQQGKQAEQDEEQEGARKAGAGTSGSCSPREGERARVEAGDAVMWKKKAEAALRSYRIMLSQAQAAQQERMKQTAKFASVKSERDFLEEANATLTDNLVKTREALQETQAELATLKALLGKRPQRSSPSVTQPPRPPTPPPPAPAPASASAPPQYGPRCPYLFPGAQSPSLPGTRLRPRPPAPQTPTPPSDFPAFAERRPSAFAPALSVSAPSSVRMGSRVSDAGFAPMPDPPSYERAASYPPPLEALGVPRRGAGPGAGAGTGALRGGAVFCGAELPVREEDSPAERWQDTRPTAPAGSRAWVQEWQQRLRRRHSSAMGRAVSHET